MVSMAKQYFRFISIFVWFLINNNYIITFYLIATGGGTADGKIKIWNITVGDTYQLYAGAEKLLLANGDSVQVNASANNAISTVTSYTSI